MGHGQVPFFPFFLKATCFPTGRLIKNLVSKYPDGKMGEMEVSGGIRKTGYFLGLVIHHHSCVPCLRMQYLFWGVGGGLDSPIGAYHFKCPQVGGALKDQVWACHCAHTASGLGSAP